MNNTGWIISNKNNYWLCYYCFNTSLISPETKWLLFDNSNRKLKLDIGINAPSSIVILRKDAIQKFKTVVKKNKYYKFKSYYKNKVKFGKIKSIEASLFQNRICKLNVEIPLEDIFVYPGEKL